MIRMKKTCLAFAAGMALCVLLSACAQPLPLPSPNPQSNPPEATIPAQTPLPTEGKDFTVAGDRESALIILMQKVTLDPKAEFADAALEDPSGYAWDDGSFFVFTVRDKVSGDVGDIGSMYLVQKESGDVYQPDLQKDVTGNTLKKVENASTF